MLNNESARALVLTPPQGIASFVASVSTAGSLDLQTLGNQTYNIQNSNQQKPGAANSFCTVYNDSANVLYISTSLAAQTIAAATTGTNAAGACAPIPANSSVRFRIRPVTDRFLNYVAASASTMRVFITSDQG